MRATTVLLITSLFASPVMAERLPIFDAHIHYSHDAVKLLPPKDAVAVLRAAGLRKALVSSADDDGTLLLLAAAPDLIVASLSPYRRRGEFDKWMHDETVINYLDARVGRHPYRAIGEFHAYGDDINTKVLQYVIALAKKHKLLLHAHSDAAAIELIFKYDPDALVLWAHSGFDPPETVRKVLARHKNLWADLAIRADQSYGGKVAEDWLPVFRAFPDRFMVGTDTYSPERWFYVADHADFSRKWLSSLPKDLAHRIAYKNAEEMIARVIAAGKGK